MLRWRAHSLPPDPAIRQQINRNPTMLPSDIQRVTAVDKHHDVYGQYRNVIVCSVKGEQSLASKLAGGGSYSHLPSQWMASDIRVYDRLRWRFASFSHRPRPFLTHRITDTAILIWNPEIVSAFRQPELSAVPEGFLAENFEKQIELMESLYAKIFTMDEAEAEQELHRVFVDGLLYEPRTGIYSNLHSASLYERGYHHPDTVRLAHM